MRKSLSVFFSAALAFAMLPASAFAAPVAQSAADAPLAAQSADTAVMYRLYNPNSGEHFYTASPVERQAVIDAGWDDEGEGWTAPTEGVQVYRLYNSFAGEHHYTTSPEERDMLVGAGWTWEEGGWYSDANQAVPLYRAYNPNAFANNHHYTTDWGEFQTLLSLGWQDEGIGWYGVNPNAWGNEDWGNSGDEPSSPSNPESPTPTPTPTPTPDPTPTPTPTPTPDPTPTPTPTPDPTPSTPDVEKEVIYPTEEVIIQEPPTPAVTTAKYTVNHWQQKLKAGSAQNATNYTRAETESLSAEVGTSVTPEVQQYAGFTAPAARTVTVKSDGSTKVDYYYTRNSYQVTVTKDDGITSTTGGGSVQYGASTSVSATVKTGNDFAGWNGSLSSSNSTYSFSMPAGNVSLVATSEPKQSVTASNGLKPASIATGYYTIYSSLSTTSSNRKNLDMSKSDTKCGGNVQLWEPNNAAAQVWYIEKVSDGYYRIANGNSMLVMDMDKSSKNVQQWNHGANNPYQLWKPYKSSFNDGSIVFENKGTGLMLAVDSNANSANVKGAAKSNVRGQAWVLNKTTFTRSNVMPADGYYRLRTQAGSADKYLNVYSNATTNGGNVQLFKNDNTSACVWHVCRVSGDYYRITGAYSALCLDVAAGSTADGANVQQYVCNGTDAQLWRFERSMYGGYVLVNKAGRTLDVDTEICKDGQNVHSWTKNDTAAQSWTLEAVSGYSVMNRAAYDISDSTYLISNQAESSKSYIDIPNASTANGEVAQVWWNTQSNAQVFRITPTGAGNGAYWIENVNSGKRLEIPSGSKTEGAPVAQHDKNDTHAQRWYAKRSIYGGCIFVNSNSGMALDLTGGATTNGTKLHQWTLNDTKAQSWVIKQQAPYKAPQPSQSPEVKAKEIYNAYNKYRASKGLKQIPWWDSCAARAMDTVKYNAATNTCALKHADEWWTGLRATTNPHTGETCPAIRDEKDPNKLHIWSDILQFTGWDAPAQEVVDGWIHSTGHRKMMQCDSAYGVGVACYNNHGVWYYAIVYVWDGSSNQSGS